MNVDKKVSINISWVIVLLCILLSIFTNYTISLYSIFHWNILPIAFNLGGYVTPDEKLTIFEVKDENEYLKEKRKKFVEACGEVFRQVTVYPITGLFGFILSFIPFFFKPRWIGFVSLPFGLYCFILASLTM